jgi:hypothetical protein
VLRRRGSLIWYSTAAVVNAGGAPRLLRSSEDPEKKPVVTNPTLDASIRKTETSTPPEAAAPSPASILAGHWRSASGRDFVAALASDDTLEFRIQQASQHARQGYEDGEVRFKLLPIPNSKDEFAVEDHLRPVPLPGFEYDPKTSRESCVGVWTTAKGKLLAQFDGAGQLTVDFVQIRTGPEKFKTQGKRVTACIELGAAPAEPIESKLSRAP